MNSTKGICLLNFNFIFALFCLKFQYNFNMYTKLSLYSQTAIKPLSQQRLHWILIFIFLFSWSKINTVHTQNFRSFLLRWTLVFPPAALDWIQFIYKRKRRRRTAHAKMSNFANYRNEANKRSTRIGLEELKDVCLLIKLKYFLMS